MAMGIILCVDCGLPEAECGCRDLLSASEAVYGLLGWLTCRDEPVTFSAKHNACIAADLAAKFCKANNLSEPKGDWSTHLIHPKGEVAVSGRGKNNS